MHSQLRERIRLLPVVVHGVSEDPTRVLTETIFELMGITPTLHGGQAQAKLDEHQPVFMPQHAVVGYAQNLTRPAFSSEIRGTLRRRSESPSGAF